MKLSKSFFFISPLFALIILILSIIHTNRAFMIGSLSGLVFLTYLYKKLKINLKSICLVIMLWFTSIALCAFFIKTDSSKGRLLIYKISIQMFKVRWPNGVGQGKFKLEYGKYQASFFSNPGHSKDDFLRADNVFFAFNDYWEIILEWGVVGILSCLLVLMGLGRLYYSVIKRVCIHHPSIFFITLNIILLVAALFTHIFERPILVCFFLVSNSYLFTLLPIPSLNLKSIKVFIGSICISVLIFQGVKMVAMLQNRLHLEEARSLDNTGYLNSSQKLYEKLYESSQNNVEYLQEYAMHLWMRGNPTLAVRLLEKCLSIRSDYRIYRLLARIYNEMGMDKKAEEAYILAINMVPNRFQTRYELLKFYIKVNKTKKAFALSGQIANMPVKIPSQQVEFIKYENNKIYKNLLKPKS